MNNTSWKTSAAGLGGIAGSLATIFLMLRSGSSDYATLGLLVSTLCVSIGHLFARDNNVSSEEVGATPQQKNDMAAVLAQAKSGKLAIAQFQGVPLVSSPPVKTP